MRRIFTLLFFSLLCVLHTYAAITVTDTITNACNTNGAIKLGASGGVAPYKFKLGYGTYQSNGAFTGLGYGNYFFTVADATGATDTLTLTVRSTFSTVITYHSAIPSVTAVVSGGTAPYQYFWPGFYQNSFSDSAEIRGTNFEQVPPGNYLVQVKDNNGCLTADSIMNAGNSSLAVSVRIKSGSSCYTEDDDSVEVNGSGGVPGYYYQIGSTLVFGEFPGNVYYISGTGYKLAEVNDDANNTAVTYFHYSQPLPLQLQATVNPASSAQQQDGSIKLFTYGGQGNYTYHWANAATAANLTGLAPGTYRVTVTELGGCSVTAAFIVGPPALSLANVTNVTCYGDSTGSVTVGFVGTYSPYVFSGDGGMANPSNTFNQLAAGTHTFYITDSTGARDSVTATITQPAALVISPTIQNPDSGTADGFISVNVTGGTPGYRYHWSIGINNTQNYLSGLFPGIYTVTVTDAQNCTTSSTYDLVLSGIEDLSANHITLQPNPTTGAVTISGLPANETVIVYDIAGRLVYNAATTGVQQTINLSAQQAGVYVLKVVNAAGVCVGEQKVVKQ